MATIDVFNLKREKVGTLNLADEVFATEVNEGLFYEIVKAQLASRRQGTAAAKERSAVSGSTKKLYKQKGTGRARHGSIRAPVFVGGGQAHRLDRADVHRVAHGRGRVAVARDEGGRRRSQGGL